MARHLAYNPGRDSVEYLETITCGANRHHILEQLVLALRAEIGRPNHQHHLLIGPRGAGKTHLLRLLTAGRITADPQLANAYLPVVMPEETPLRSPADLFLKFVERLAELLKEPTDYLSPDAIRNARGICLSALTTARGIRDSLKRLDVMAEALESIAKTLGRILLPVAENMDQTFYLGTQGGRKGPLDEQWSLRRHLQDSPHLLLIAAAPSIFGAVGDPGKPFYDFFRTHELQELSNDEVLEIIRLRLESEAAKPGSDGLRAERVRRLLDHLPKNTPQLRGLLAITGGLPRFVHLIYEVIVETDLEWVMDTLDAFLDEMTPYFQHRLDPRFIPQAEMDLLHSLAIARGPQQPSELAEQLYGVSTNEVSELLGRLQERGLVKRAGRPGGQAVTWDLTEPLYRVWTQFRDNPTAQEQYRLLAEFVAILFRREEIEAEREQLSRELTCLPDGSGKREGVIIRQKILESAIDYLTSSKVASELVATPATIAVEESHWVKKARELFKSLNAARKTGDKEHCLSLLNELRALAHTYPGDGDVRKPLARGLFNAFNAAADAEDWGQCDNLLNELRDLSQAWPEDDAVRESLASGLVNATYTAGKAGNRERCNALLDELRRLSRKWLEDGAVRNRLAMGLVNAFNTSTDAEDWEQCNNLLNELRGLSQAWPEDDAVRENFAMGLSNAIYAAGKAGDQERGNALLDELRHLSQAWPEEGAMREKFASGLFNAANTAGKAGDREHCESLVEELRELSRTWQEDGALRKPLARGLFIAFKLAGKEEDQAQCDSLLDELRLLSRAWPEDGAVRDSLARGMVNAINAAGKKRDQAQCDRLLEELRLLSRTWPKDGVVRERLASGLSIGCFIAIKAGNFEQGKYLLEELFSLSDSVTEQIIERAVIVYCFEMLDRMKAGDVEVAKSGMQWLEVRLPARLAGLFQPATLAMQVLENGAEKALAREPEEMRRVVQMLLEKLD